MKRKETTLAESVGIIVLMLIVLTGCCCILRINEQMALLFCALFLATYAGTKGYTAVEIEKMAIDVNVDGNITILDLASIAKLQNQK